MTRSRTLVGSPSRSHTRRPCRRTAWPGASVRSASSAPVAEPRRASSLRRGHGHMHARRLRRRWRLRCRGVRAGDGLRGRRMRGRRRLRGVAARAAHQVEHGRPGQQQAGQRHPQAEQPGRRAAGDRDRRLRERRLGPVGRAVPLLVEDGDDVVAVQAQVLGVGAHETARVGLGRQRVQAVILDRPQLRRADAGGLLDPVERDVAQLALLPQHLAQRRRRHHLVDEAGVVDHRQLPLLRQLAAGAVADSVLTHLPTHTSHP